MKTIKFNNKINLNDKNNVVKVKDYPNLYRDLDSNAIININKEEYELYLEKKRQILLDKAKIRHQEDEINSIKNELQDIKNLLKYIVETQDANDK